MAVLDASCYVALINAHEPGHEAASVWFRQAVSKGEEVVAPNIILAEVAAALSRGMGDAGLAHRVVARLKNSNVIQLTPIMPRLAELAAAVAVEQRIRGCDAVYVALALQRHDTLITLDRQQLERGAVVVQTRRP